MTHFALSFIAQGGGEGNEEERGDDAVHVICFPISDGFLMSFLIKGSVSLCLKFSGQANEQGWNQMASGQHLMFCFKDIIMGVGVWKKTLLFERRESADNSFAQDDLKMNGMGLPIPHETTNVHQLLEYYGGPVTAFLCQLVPMERPNSSVLS